MCGHAMLLLIVVLGFVGFAAPQTCDSRLEDDLEAPAEALFDEAFDGGFELSDADLDALQMPATIPTCFTLVKNPFGFYLRKVLSADGIRDFRLVACPPYPGGATVPCYRRIRCQEGQAGCFRPKPCFPIYRGPQDVVPTNGYSPNYSVLDVFLANVLPCRIARPCPIPKPCTNPVRIIKDQNRGIVLKPVKPGTANAFTFSKCPNYEGCLEERACTTTSDICYLKAVCQSNTGACLNLISCLPAGPCVKTAKAPTGFKNGLVTDAYARAFKTVTCADGCIRQLPCFPFLESCKFDIPCSGRGCYVYRTCTATAPPPPPPPTTDKCFTIKSDKTGDILVPARCDGFTRVACDVVSRPDCFTLEDCKYDATVPNSFCLIRQSCTVDNTTPQCNVVVPCT